MNTNSNKKKYFALTISILLTSFCILLVILITDIPLKEHNFRKRTKVAAVIIRDDVVPFQKFGSKLFTLYYIKNNYETFRYFTQYHSEDKENEFITFLSEVLYHYNSVDIFILSHSNTYYQWVSEINPKLTVNIRLVYNTGCGNSEQADLWIDLGADSYVAHTAKRSISPIFYFFFLRRWTKGYSLDNAVQHSNKLSFERMHILNFFLKDNRIDELNPEALIFGNEKLHIK